MRMFISISFVVFMLAPKVSAADWPMFGRDPQHTGHTDVNFPSEDLEILWTFDLGKHTWKYTTGTSVWSSSPVAAQVDGKTVIFVGAYDHNLYCIDASTGKEFWRFTVGGTLNFAPVFSWVKGTPSVFVASSDRTVYAIHAGSGRKLWSYETYPWTYTVYESVASSPIVVDVEGRPTLFLGMWNSDRKSIKGFQHGELLAFDAQKGEKLWGRSLSPTYLSSPAYAEMEGSPVILIASADGNIYCVQAAQGREVWRFTAGAAIYSSPTVTELDGDQIAFVGTRFGMVYALSVQNGELLWNYKAGHAVDSTLAVGSIGGRQTLFFGSYDRLLHAVDAETGERIWYFATGKYISASPVVAKIGGNAAVFFNSLDDTIYAVDGENGKALFAYKGGSRLWPYETRGESLWSSPIVIDSSEVSSDTKQGSPLLLFPSCDGRLYAYTAGRE